MRQEIRQWRRAHSRSLSHFETVQKAFDSFLNRPSSVPELMQSFQENFNTMSDPSIRSDSDVKSELFMRVDDLRKSFWDIAERRRLEAEAEASRSFSSPWLEDHVAILHNLIVAMMKREVERFRVSHTRA